MPYFSDIQYRKVIEPSGDRVGSLKDIAVMPRGELPAIEWAILATRDGEQVVRWTDLAQEIGHLRLRGRLATIGGLALPDDAVRLARDLMDRSIVDTQEGKVVEVNDLELSDIEGRLRLVGADVGWRGLLRRLGAEGIAEALTGGRLPRRIVPWHLLKLADAARATD